MTKQSRSARRKYFRLRVQQVRAKELEAQAYREMYYAFNELDHVVLRARLPLEKRRKIWRAFHDGWKRVHLDLLISGEVETLEGRKEMTL